MTNHTCQLVFRASCLFGMTIAAAAAQSVSSPTTAEEEAVQLSPFVITDQADKGYLAKETLAGMRIKTDLKDAAAAIDVLTEKFLDDVGAVDMNQALKYVVNMGYQDGSLGGDIYNNAQWFSASYYSRGLGAGTVLTDFFPTGSVPIDRYNTENLTMMRGANAILFGIGNPAGIVGSSSKRAKWNKDQWSVRFLADTWGSARTEFDVNRILLKDRLAIRLAVVASDQHNDQEPSLNRRQAAFGTVTYKPFRKTSITISGEKGIYDRYFAQWNVISDAYTPWVLSGRPTVNFVTGKGMVNGSTVKGNFNLNIGSGLGRTSQASYLTHIDGSNLPVMDWRNMARGANWSEMVPAGNPGSGLMLNADRGQLGSISFTRKNAITDLRASAWGGLNRNDLDYDNRSIFWDQNVTRDLDFEIAYNELEQEYLFTRKVATTGATIFVDPNEVLPNGAPNPYVGMPYIETSNTSGGNAPKRSKEWRGYRNFRMTLSYKLDLDHRKLFRNLGLGNYLLAANYQDSENRVNLLETRYVNVTPLTGPNSSTLLNSNVNMLNRRYYLKPGESSWGAYSGPPNFVQSSVPGATIDGPLKFEERNSGDAPRNSVQNEKGWVAALQGSWWRAKQGYFHITGMYGFRRDAQTTRSQSFTRQANGEYLPPLLDFKGLASYGVWGPNAEFNPRTKTYNVTVRPISQIRLFYNFSDIFQSPAASFLDVFGNQLAPAVGKTKDYGVKLDLLGERLFVTATKYETGVYNQSRDNTGSVRGPINDIYNAINRPDLVLERPFSLGNNVSTGYEFSLNASITPNWQVRMNYGTQKTVPDGLYDEFVVYFDQNRALWQANASTSLLQPQVGYATVADAMARADRALIDQRAGNGVLVRGQRPRNATFNTSYAFSEGRLKDLRVGGGFQWQTNNVIGYARDPLGNLDLSRPYLGAKQFSTDAFIGYSRMLFKGKVRWEIHLNIRNLLNEDPLLARVAVDDGTGAGQVTLRGMQDRFSAQLSNTFRF
jgi:outer membrane receptor for ferric coprogen and ferric-rhodotorulic acid